MEWQLASTDLSSVRRWLAEHGTIDGLVLEPRSTLNIFDTYLDTHDWRIHRAGFALRIRSESGKSEVTLKSLHSASTDVGGPPGVERNAGKLRERVDSTFDWSGRNARTRGERCARLAAIVRSAHLETEIRDPQGGRGEATGRDCPRRNCHLAPGRRAQDQHAAGRGGSPHGGPRAAAIAGENSPQRLCARGGVRHEVLAGTQIGRLGTGAGA